MEALSGSDAELITFLSSYLLESVLDKAQRLLASRDNSLKAAMENNFLEELSLKEVEKFEAKHRCDELEREMHALKARCADLEDKVEKGEEILMNLEEVNKRCALFESAMGELQKEVVEWKKKYEEYSLRVSQLMDENSRLRNLSEQKHRPLEGNSITGAVVSTDCSIEDGDKGKKDSILTWTPKRKSRLKIVSSDSEGQDSLVRIPIGILKRRRGLEKAKLENEGSDDLGVPNSSFCRNKKSDGYRVKRRLFPLGGGRTEAEDTNVHSPPDSLFGDDSPTKNNKRTSRSPAAVKWKLMYSDSNDDYDDNDEEDSGYESEGASLGGFIVSGSDNSEGKLTSSHASEEESTCGEDEFTTDEDLETVFSKIRHKREDKNKWEYEADMLASFAKDSKLCMEAVCALYRMQTAEEKSVKGTILLNNRGFNTCDAHRGSKIAEFLMDGDPQCQLRKSVEELKMYDPTGPDYCQKLASRYSKQLFKIYKNNEDPFFPNKSLF